MSKRRKWIIVAAVVIVLAIIGGALGGDDAPEAAQPKQAATATQAASETPTPEPTTTETEETVTSECLAVPDAVSASLAESMGDGTVTKSAAVKSTIADTYIVAIQLTGGGFEGDTATFEVASIEQASSTRAVDGFAKQFTNFPESAYSLGDEDVKAAHACLI